MTIVIDITNDAEAGLDAALAALRAAKLVAVPTETVYGLAADARNPDAVAAVFTAKGRPSFNPLICHVSGLEMAQKFGVFNEIALRLAQKFWPGPLTLVVPRTPGTGLADAVTAGLDTIAMRHAPGIMATLAEQLGGPIAAPSANRSGCTSPTTARHVIEELEGRVEVVLDGGPCDVGVESTIVKTGNDRIAILRPGGITRDQLVAAMDGFVVEASAGGAIEAPGMLISHYAPNLPLRLNAKVPGPGEALLAFGKGGAGGAGAQTPVCNLSETGNLTEAAHNLYAMLKRLDSSGACAIAVQPVPESGIGVAINDRLRRAAAPRSANG